MPLWSHAVYFLDVLAFGSVCGGDTPPVQPPVPQSPPKTSKKLRIEVVNPSGQPIVGAAVTILGQHPYEAWQVGGPTDAEGIYRFDTFGLGVTPVLVTVTAAGFVTWSELMPIPADDDWSYRRTLEAVPVPVYPFPEELGPLTVSGDLLLRTDGSAFDWRGISDFLRYARFLRGEPMLSAFQQARSLGANVAHWFLEVRNPGWTGWEDFLLPDLSHLPEALAEAKTMGLRVEVCVLTYQHPTIEEARQRLQQTFDLCAGIPNILVRCANEPDVNSIDVVSAMQGVNTRGCLWAWGYYEPHNGQLVTAGQSYGTFHGDRGRFPRGEKVILEYRDGGVEDPPIPATHQYWVDDEPQKAAAPGSPATQYSSEPRDFQSAAALCRMYGGGFTLHTENGRYGRPLDATEIACGQAILEAEQFMPALFGRSYLAPHNTADFGIVWQESDSSQQHVYGADAPDGTRYIVLCQPTLSAPFYQALAPGWQLVKQTSLGMVLQLRRV